MRLKEETTKAATMVLALLLIAIMALPVRSVSGDRL